jgi:hypothetical protein
MARPNPEDLLTGSSDIQGLVANYEHSLQLVVNDSDLALTGLAYWTDTYRASGLSLQRFLNEQDKRLVEQLEVNKRTTSLIIGMVPELLHSMPDFSRSDRAAYQEAQRAYSMYSAKSDVGRQIGDQLVRQAIYTALDKRVLKEAQTAFSLYSAKSDIHRHASSSSAQEAMNRNLDGRVYSEARNAFSLYSAKSDIRSHASGKPAKLAMEAALDRFVLRDVKQAFSIYSAKSDLTAHASSNIDQQIMDEILFEFFPDDIIATNLKNARLKFMQNHQIPSFISLDSLPSRARVKELQETIDSLQEELSDLGKLSFVKRTKINKDIKIFEFYINSLKQQVDWLEANPDIVQQWQAIEANIRSGSRTNQEQSRTHQNTARQQRTKTKQAKQIPQNESIYQAAVRALTNAEHSLGFTLTSYPKKSVLKVINTVILARESAAKKGKELSDRDILLRYMKISNTNPNPTPDQTQATQIMLTLMGNKVSGKLPF